MMVILSYITKLAYIHHTQIYVCVLYPSVWHNPKATFLDTTLCGVLAYDSGDKQLTAAGQSNSYVMYPHVTRRLQL